MSTVLQFESPVGPMELVAEGDTLTRAHFVVEVGSGQEPIADNASGVLADPASGLPTTEAAEAEPGCVQDDGAAGVLDDAQRQFEAYFAGELKVFDLPLAPRGTAFQRRVWDELTSIPFGVTASYGEIAARLGMPTGASRAVGTANGANPIAIIVPCHRVIGANGKLVGYAGGLDRKRTLLNLESTYSGQAALFS